MTIVQKDGYTTEIDISDSAHTPATPSSGFALYSSSNLPTFKSTDGVVHTVGTVTSVASGTGLTGGPITSTGTLSISNTAVSAASYTVGNFTVNAQGQLTAASSATVITDTHGAASENLSIGLSSPTTFTGIDKTTTVGNGAGLSIASTASKLTFLGYKAGNAVTATSSCVAVGDSAMLLNTVQGNQVALGSFALAGLNDAATDCRFNTACGAFALQFGATQIGYNTAIGSSAFGNSSAANINNSVALGYKAGFSLTSGTTGSIFIGYTTGSVVTSCTNCTVLGTSADIGTASGISNAMALGANTTVNASNAVNIGSSCYVGLNNTTPLYNLDIAAISSVAAIRVADSSSTPSTPSGAALYYSVSGIPTYMNSNAVARAIPHRTQVSVSGTTKTLAITDTDTFQLCSNGSTQTITVPTNASVAFPVDTEIDFFQQGVGQVVFAAAGGVTIQSMFSNLKVAAQYSGATLKNLSTDTWALVGNLTA